MNVERWLESDPFRCNGWEKLPRFSCVEIRPGLKKTITSEERISFINKTIFAFEKQSNFDLILIVEIEDKGQRQLSCRHSLSEEFGDS